MNTKCQTIGELWACQHLPVSSIQLLYIILMLGRRYKIFFLNLKLPIHIGVPRAYMNILCLNATPLIFQFRPYLVPSFSERSDQKSEGGPLGENNNSLKKFSTFYSFVIHRTL